MRPSAGRFAVAARAFALLAITALGLAAIVGSGGGGGDGASSCGIFISASCDFTPTVTFDYAQSPRVQTVQVGGTATFKISTNAAHSSYQWKRSSDRGRTYVNIPGATSPSYSLAGVQLSDDQALFLADVSSPGAQPSVVSFPIPGALLVSASPGVIFQDSEFQPADWAAAIAPDPSPSGATHSEEQATTGGNPGAFRRMTIALPSGPSSLRVSNVAQMAHYDPPVSGGVYSVDFAEDCAVVNTSPTIVYVSSNPVIEQSGRTFVSYGAGGCQGSTWQSLTSRPSLRVGDFVQVDGPVCGPGEACPDFSASAAPLRFGYVREAMQAAGSAAGSIVHGIDNWKVTVWRR